MTDDTAIAVATRRLQAAIDALEVALEQRQEAGTRESVLADQIHTLDSDRSRLAAELDHAAARVKALETTNREIAKRLDGAIETIRAVVATPESEGK